MAMFKAFKPSGMEKIARSMGYQGKMEGFTNYLSEDPSRQQQMQGYTNNAIRMAGGGLVFNGGGDVNNPFSTFGAGTATTTGQTIGTSGGASGYGDDFESDEEVIKDYSLVIDALARNKTYTSGILDSAAYSDDGPSEFFRDLTSRIGTKVNIASEVKNWSDEEKQAFTRMQTKWDNVSVSGLKEYMGVIKDYGIDAVANLESIPALASLIFQGGTGVAAAQVTSRAALSKVLAKVAAASSPTTKKGFAAYGAAFGGAEDISLQNLQIETGAKEDFSLGNVAVAAGLGAVAGAGLKKGMELFKGRNTSRLANKQAEIDLENKLIVEIPEEDGLKVFEAGLAKGDIPLSANNIILDLGKLSNFI